MMDKRVQLRQHFQAEATQAQAHAQYKQRTAQLNTLEDSMLEAFNVLIKFIDGKTTKTEVVNQLESISTPDVDKVVTAVSKLDADILANKLDLKPVVDALNSMKRELGLIPKSLPKIPEQKDTLKVTNLDEIKLDTSDVVKAIKDLKLVAEAPIINEKEVDLKPLQNVMLDLLSAVKSQKPVEIPKFPEIPKTDLAKVETKLDTANKLLKEITEKRFGGSGGGGGNGTPYVDNTGKAVYVELIGGAIPISGGAGGGGALSTSAKGATAVGSPTSTNASADRTLLDVTLRDTSGNAVSVGGGTQYTDGAVRGTPTGTVMMVDDGTNIQSAKGDSAGRLDVNVNGTVPVSGTVAVTGVATETTLGTRLAESTFTTRIPVQGQALAAASIPVVLTAAQVTTLTPPAAITGFATSALQSTQDTSINTLLKPASTLTAVTTVTNLAQQGGTAISIGTGVRDAGTQRVTIATNDSVPVTGTFFQATQPVSLATAPTTPVTGTFFQATQPVSLATAPSTPVTNAGTFAVQAAATLAAETTKVIGTVNIAAAQTLANVTTVGTITNTVPTKQVRSATPAQSSPSVTTGNTVVLASNANRLGATIYNEGSVACFIKLGATASATSYSVKMAVDGYYEVPFNYTGAIDGITASGTATLRVTELT